MSKESQRWPQSHFSGLGHQTALWLILLWSVTYILTMSTYRDKGHNLLLSLMREWNKESLQSNKLLLFCVTYLLHFWFGMFYYAHKVTVWLWDINAWFYSQKGEDNSNRSLWHLHNVCNLHNPYKMPPTECWPLHATHHKTVYQMLQQVYLFICCPIEILFHFMQLPLITPHPFS